MAKAQTEQSGPRHVAIIMDGNGRWAQMRGRPRLFGHHAGAKRVREIVEACPSVGIDIIHGALEPADGVVAALMVGIVAREHVEIGVRRRDRPADVLSCERRKAEVSTQ